MNKLTYIYWRYIASAEAYARHLGVTIGQNCFINTRSWSSEPYLVSIGNNVAITENVHIHTHGGARVARRLIHDFDIFGKVIIEDNVYVGTGSQIMPGVKIGEGSLIAAGSIVTKSVPPHSVVAGNPAKYICSVEDYIEKNKKYNTHTYGIVGAKKKLILESLPSDKFIMKNIIKADKE